MELIMIKAKNFTLDPSWKVILKDIGVNINEVLKRARLPFDIFTKKEAKLTPEEYFRFWNAIEGSSNDPSFSLNIGQSFSTEAFHPVFFAALCCPNLNEALIRISRYKPLVGPLVLHVNIKNDCTTISFECLNTENPLPDSLVATELVFFVHLARLATRENINPISVFSTNEIATNTKDYEDYFNVKPVLKNINQLKFSKEDALRPFLTENHKMLDFFEPELKKRLSNIEAETSFAQKVRSSLFELLPSGRSSADDVAKSLAVSKRTLQRYLKNEKTSFMFELNETRKSLAEHYLVNSDLSTTEISFLLAFEEPNSFIRAFRIWTGKTPNRLREIMHSA